MAEINVQEILTKEYIRVADALIATGRQHHTLKGSNTGFRLMEGSKVFNDTWLYKLEFDRSFDFGFGNWSNFFFNSKEELGRFIWEAVYSNNGYPKGAKGFFGNTPVIHH